MVFEPRVHDSIDWAHTVSIADCQINREAQIRKPLRNHLHLHVFGFGDL